MSCEDTPEGVYYRQFYKEVKEVGEFVHQQTGSFHRTQRKMSGGIKQSRSTKKYENRSGLWALNGDVRKVAATVVSIGRPRSTQWQLSHLSSA